MAERYVRPGFLTAYDAKTGEKRWRFNCGVGINAPPISFAVDGKQMIAVVAGGSQIWGAPAG